MGGNEYYLMMQTILYHNSSGSEAFTGSLKKKEVHHAITLHPVKQHTNMYRIHNYMKSLKIQALQRELVLLERDIQASKRELGEKTPLQTAVFSDPPGLNKFHPRKAEDVLMWDFISRSIYSATNINPRRRMESPLKEGLEDVVGEVMDTINMHSKQRGRVIEFREILYGYYRLDPLHGADYILDMLLVYKKYRGRKMTVPVRRHVYLQQQFGGLEIRETVDGVEVPHSIVREQELDEPANLQADMSDNNLLGMGDLQPPLEIDSSPTDAVGTKIINFILPLSGRFAAFQRFVGVFEEVCLQRDKYVSLIVVLYQNPQAQDSFNQSASEVRRLQSVYPHNRVVLVPVFEKFARARALQLGASQVTDNTQDLLFLVDVDMVFMSATLQRIRTNTVKGKEVYFPIVFSEFDPSIVYGISGLKTSSNHFRIDDDTGFWRQFGFGIVSIYKCDLMQVGGFDTTIQGWGKEDVNLYDKIVAFKNLTVFRAVDPTLVHVFHVVDCDPSLEETQLRMCEGSRYDTYGSAQQLAKYIYSHEEIIKYLEKKVQKPLS
uniref:Hexosyltransferase n=1 Tax=Timema genevievae TaxID=629358 RepID=A0A7R9K0B1_TIMGE|nr:unnamed protein product [Timema genevievae]